MANLPLKKKYTIWQTLRDGGFFRVFRCPDYPNLWGTEKKLTWKHNQVNRFFISLKEGNHILGNLEFDNAVEAIEKWEKLKS